MGVKSAVRNATKTVMKNPMRPSQNEKDPPTPPAEAGPDSAKSPIKLPESPSDREPEIPRVGTADAPGG